MNRLATIILGASLALVPTAFTGLAQSSTQFGNLPLWFEAAQTGKFIAHGSRSDFVVTSTGAEFSLTKASGEVASGQLQFIGANPAARVSGDQPLPGKINYLVGRDASQWHANIPTFARIQVEAVYPGVNVVYYGNHQRLEYDFNLAAGVNPAVISLRFAGAEQISVNPQGELVIQFKAGEIVQHTPVAYQIINCQRQEIAAGYKILDSHTAAFALGDFDRHQPLVIDPVLSYSTYYGANYGESAWSIAVNPTDGSVYVAGQTFSTKVTNNIPFWTAGALQTTNLGGKQAGDAFIARFDATGTNLIYATYLGGTGDDAAYSIAVNSAGNAFIAGATVSSNFPIVNPIPSGSQISGTLQRNLKTYSTDAFVAELDPSGSSLIYSTYIGGSAAEAANGIALDSSDNAFITGFTYSTNFPVTPNAFQSQFAASNTIYMNANAFVAEIAAGGNNLNYATYLGGTNYDIGRAITFNNGRIFVTGYTFSTNFPSINCLPGYELLNGDASTNSTKNKKLAYYPDAFVTAFDVSNLSVPLYSTFLGGTNNDAANSIAADASGNAYVAGFTCSTNFPYTTTNVADLIPAFVHTNDYKKHFALATNGFLTQIKWDGVQPSLGYSTMFGGKGVNVANGVALDPAGNAYVVGSASCTNFPVTTNNISGYLSATNSSKKNKGYSDAVIIAFNADASALLYSAYLGGKETDFGNAIAVDPIGNAYIAGQTLSTNFPAVNAYQSHRSGTNDMFIAKISQVVAPVLTAAPRPVANSLAQGRTTEAMPTVPSAGLVLKWQMFPANYDVESATDLSFSNSCVLPETPAYNNGWYQLTMPTTNSSQFFRLHKR